MQCIPLQFLAVVYESFLKMEKEKLKKLMLHKRVACQHCFRLLTSEQVRVERSPALTQLRCVCRGDKYSFENANICDVYTFIKIDNGGKCKMFFVGMYEISIHFIVITFIMVKYIFYGDVSSRHLSIPSVRMS